MLRPSTTATITINVAVDDIDSDDDDDNDDDNDLRTNEVDRENHATPTGQIVTEDGLGRTDSRIY